MKPVERRAWKERCRAAGFDPDEVSMVAERYAAHRDYRPGGVRSLGLEGWFRFYCLEKQAELSYNGQGVASACSATGEGEAHRYLRQPAPFLVLVRDYLHLAGAQAGSTPGAAKSL